MIDFLRKANWLLCAQFGLDVRKFVYSVFGIPRYFRDWLRFRQQYSGALSFRPCLHDWSEEGGETRDEYFWQDLFVAQKIFVANPDKHVDIGSRIDGFAAHVASFREIEVLDIRPITSVVPGIKFQQADLMQADDMFENYCDSLSCLHALEHFGLGRYGDPIDPQGHISGLHNMAKTLKPGGTLYLSLPIGKERVEFNAQRITNPQGLVELAKGYGLILNGFALLEPGGGIKQVDDPETMIEKLTNMSYTLGVFMFLKRRGSKQ